MGQHGSVPTGIVNKVGTCTCTGSAQENFTIIDALGYPSTLLASQDIQAHCWRSMSDPLKIRQSAVWSKFRLEKKSTCISHKLRSVPSTTF